MVGTILGNRYRILREIGSGGMAWVYLAEDMKENHLIAVKVLYPQFGQDLSYIHRFNREAKLASAMTDPHIVRVLDYGADRDTYYLVMEYIEGHDLREILLEKGHFPWKSALDLLDQLTTALEHAHGHGVVHRDIKPQNIMLDDSGMLKVLDFGIARVSAMPSITQSGFIGSPYYVSPEQAMMSTDEDDRDEIDIRSDIYSAGIVFYELLSGKVPFDAKSPWSIISQHIASVPPPIELTDDEVPPPVNDLLYRMIAKNREERFQTPTALRRTISAILAGKPVPDQNLDTRPIESPDQIDMAESLFDRALEAINAEEWVRACDLLNQTLKINPDHVAAQQQLEIAEQQNFLLSRYNTAIRAMERSAWQECVLKFQEIVAVEPHYKDTQTLLERCQEALKREETQKRVAERYVEGVSHIEGERWPAALEAFQEVQQLAPGYKRTAEYLQQAERLSRPSLWQRSRQLLAGGSLSRWGVAAVIVVGLLIFVILGNRNSATGDDDGRGQLKTIYAQAQQAIENDDTYGAISLLDQILNEDPDYADAAALRRDLVVSLTPTPATPTTASDHPLAATLAEAEEALALEQWSSAIEILTEIRATEAEFESARVMSLFCDAYVGRGLETLNAIRQPGGDEKEIMQAALIDFEAGTAECPRRTDLQDQSERATAYLTALNTTSSDAEALIKTLNPIVAAAPDYAGGNARLLLYDSYLRRGATRHERSDFVGALGDYEAALALNVADPSAAQSRRAELILAFQQPGQLLAETPETPEPVATATPSPQQDGQPTRVPIALSKPVLTQPEQDAVFAGRFAEVNLAWESNAVLAEDEYFDLTVMHFFDGQPTYWGTATRETSFMLPPDVGLGQAGNDRFYWWVTIRKANSAPSANSIDLPRSPGSEARTFVWTP